jgi:AraC-like DNA-binding protein
MNSPAVLLIGDCERTEAHADRLIRHVQQTLVDGGAQVRVMLPGTAPYPEAVSDAVMVVSRERNRSYSGAIKMLLDSLDARAMSGKPFGLISYGESHPASTAVDHLRVVVSALEGVPLPADVCTSLRPTVEGDLARSIAGLVEQLLYYSRRAADDDPFLAPPAVAGPRPRVVSPPPRVGFEPAVPVDGKVYEGVARAVAYIKENYCDQSAVYMSRYHFSRKFRQETGRRFIDYLIMLRMTEARKQLLQTNWTVTAIAAAVGYRDLSNFERSFKKLFGTQPSQYRLRYAGPAPDRIRELVQLRDLDAGQRPA